VAHLRRAGDRQVPFLLEVRCLGAPAAVLAREGIEVLRGRAASPGKTVFVDGGLTLYQSFEATWSSG
jgi:hypothetical protein